MPIFCNTLNRSVDIVLLKNILCAVIIIMYNGSIIYLRKRKTLKPSNKAIQNWAQNES